MAYFSVFTMALTLTIYFDGSILWSSNGDINTYPFTITNQPITHCPSVIAFIATPNQYNDTAYYNPATSFYTSAQYDIYTFSNWKCNNVEQEGWNTFTFDDTGWPTAIVTGPSQIDPSYNSPNTLSIWNSNIGSTTYCRTTLSDTSTYKYIVGSWSKCSNVTNTQSRQVTCQSMDTVSLNEICCTDKKPKSVRSCPSFNYILYIVAPSASFLVVVCIGVLIAIIIKKDYIKVFLQKTNQLIENKSAQYSYSDIIQDPNDVKFASDTCSSLPSRPDMVTSGAIAFTPPPVRPPKKDIEQRNQPAQHSPQRLPSLRNKNKTANINDSDSETEIGDDGPLATPIEILDSLEQNHSGIPISQPENLSSPVDTMDSINSEVLDQLPQLETPIAMQLNNIPKVSQLRKDHRISRQIERHSNPISSKPISPPRISSHHQINNIHRSSSPQNRNPTKRQLRTSYDNTYDKTYQHHDRRGHEHHEKLERHDWLSKKVDDDNDWLAGHAIDPTSKPKNKNKEISRRHHKIRQSSPGSRPIYNSVKTREFERENDKYDVFRARSSSPIKKHRKKKEHRMSSNSPRRDIQFEYDIDKRPKKPKKKKTNNLDNYYNPKDEVADIGSILI